MTTYNHIENVGTGGKLIRGTLGLGLLGAVLLIPGLSPLVIAVFGFAAVYAVFTAVTGWDPFAAVSQAVQEREQQVSAEIMALPSRTQTASSHGYKQAA